MRRAAGLAVVLALAAAPGAGPAHAARPVLAGEATPHGELVVCFGYGCRAQAAVALGDGDWAAVARAFGHPRTPRAERGAVARAVATLERRVGAQAGTGGDLAGNVAGSGLPGQMDCIDESFNTTRYLYALQDRGWLRYHRVGPRARRARWWIDQHWTAVLEQYDGVRFAVDAWPRDNGHEPDIQPLAEWLRKVPPPESAHAE